MQAADWRTTSSGRDFRQIDWAYAYTCPDFKNLKKELILQNYPELNDDGLPKYEKLREFFNVLLGIDTGEQRFRQWSHNHRQSKLHISIDVINHNIVYLIKNFDPIIFDIMLMFPGGIEFFTGAIENALRNNTITVNQLKKVYSDFQENFPKIDQIGDKINLFFQDDFIYFERTFGPFLKEKCDEAIQKSSEIGQNAIYRAPQPQAAQLRQQVNQQPLDPGTETLIRQHRAQTKNNNTVYAVVQHQFPSNQTLTSPSSRNLSNNTVRSLRPAQEQEQQRLIARMNQQSHPQRFHPLVPNPSPQTPKHPTFQTHDEESETGENRATNINNPIVIEHEVTGHYQHASSSTSVDVLAPVASVSVSPEEIQFNNACKWIRAELLKSLNQNLELCKNFQNLFVEFHGYLNFESKQENANITLLLNTLIADACKNYELLPNYEKKLKDAFFRCFKYPKADAQNQKGILQHQELMQKLQNDTHSPGFLKEIAKSMFKYKIDEFSWIVKNAPPYSTHMHDKHICLWVEKKGQRYYVITSQMEIEEQVVSRIKFDQNNNASEALIKEIKLLGAYKPTTFVHSMHGINFTKVDLTKHCYENFIKSSPCVFNGYYQPRPLGALSFITLGVSIDPS